VPQGEWLIKKKEWRKEKDFLGNGNGNGNLLNAI